MPEIHLRWTICGPFTKSKERIQKFKEAGDSQYIYQKELGMQWLMEILNI